VYEYNTNTSCLWFEMKYTHGTVQALQVDVKYVEVTKTCED